MKTRGSQVFGWFGWFGGYVLALGLLVLPMVVNAQDAKDVGKLDMQAIKKQMEGVIRQVQIKSITFNSDLNMYEVSTNTDVFYLSHDMKYVFIGNIIDIATKTNITERNRANIVKNTTSEVWSPEILKHAVKIDGKSKVAVIEITDPECAYCREASKYFASKDATRYIFFYPLSGMRSTSANKAIHIICSDNQTQAYYDIYTGAGVNKLTHCKQGESVLVKHREVAEKLNILGTPTFVIGNSIIRGLNIKAIEGLINSLSQQKEE